MLTEADPWKIEEAALLLGLGTRAATAAVHEAAAPEMWIAFRAAGFRESAGGEMRGIGRMLLENSFEEGFSR